MSQGNLVKWCVKEGEEVTAGTVLAEIETDKVSRGASTLGCPRQGWPNPHAGRGAGTMHACMHARGGQSRSG